MKNIIALMLLLCISHSCFSQTGKFQEIPYNRKQHSVKEHSKLIASSYGLIFKFSRAERKTIYHDILKFYAANGVNETPEKLHLYLQDKMKAVLTVNEYSVYQKMSNYFEFIFAKGAPNIALK